MPLLTIFTPCYNEAGTLQRLYKSLSEQVIKDFVWLIVDDGSTDKTQELAEKWADNCKSFKIEYVRKEKGGIHTAWNRAIELADTELLMYLSAIDYMPKNAVANICRLWNEKGSKAVGGIVGFNSLTDEILTSLRLNSSDNVNEEAVRETVTLNDIHIGSFDKVSNERYVIRTALFKALTPMPEYEGESFFNPFSIIIRISREYEFLFLNDNICFVGRSDTEHNYSLYYKIRLSPNGYADMFLLNIGHPEADKKYIFKQSVLYCCCCMLAKRKKYIEKSPHKRITGLAKPFARIMYIYVRIKGRKRKDTEVDEMMIFQS
ncbi:MAG: glycosyltransferase family 2 protein [Ruminococcus sp.]|nr:glycosyltransferase family 2 protein [Ruminococcus sp.]